MRPASAPPPAPATPHPPPASTLGPPEHPTLTREQSREIPANNEGVLAMPEVELEEIEGDSASDRTRTEEGPGKAAGEKGGGGGRRGSGDDKAGDLEKAGAAEEELEWTYPDGGLKAWSVVLGAHIFACCQMGYGLTWGVYAAELHANVFPDVPIGTINLVAGLANFCMGGSALVAGRLAEKFGYKRMVAISTVATAISLIVSGLVYKSLAGLFIVQGFCLGISMGAGMPVYLSIPSQWFLKRRGLATGLVGGGTGVGGGASALIVRFLMPAVGYRKTIIIYACINLVLCCIAYCLLEVRLPPLKPGERRLPKNWLPTGMGRDPAIYSMCGCVFVGTFGYLNVPYFMTGFTELKNPQLSTTSITVALPLIIGNFMQFPARVCAGLIADRIGPVNAFFSSFFLGGLLQVAVWPHVARLKDIIGFCVAYNFIGSWFISLMPVCAAQLFGVKGLATITGLLLLCNSPGQFLSGTLGGLILDSPGGYSGVAYFSGSMMVGGALILLVARFQREKNVFARF